MNWWRRVAQNRLLDVGAFVLAGLSVLNWARLLPSRWSECDFNHYYAAGRMLWDGQNPYTTSLRQMSAHFGFAFSEDIAVSGYPPAFLWMFAPLTMLSPRTAFVVWVAGEIACLACILWLTRHLLGERLSCRGWRMVIAVTLMSRAVLYHFYFSQTQLLLAALVLAAFAWHQKGKHTAACVAVTVAGLLKIYPFLLLPWFFLRGPSGWRLCLRKLTVVLCVAVAVFTLTGPSLWVDFLQRGTSVSVGQQIGRNFQFSVPALVINLSEAISARDFGNNGDDLWRLAGAMSGLIVIGSLAYVLCWRYAGDHETEFSFLMVAMLAATVATQGHYFVLLIFPMALAAVHVAARPTGWRVTLFAILLLALNDIDPRSGPFWDRHIHLKILTNSVPVFGLLGLAMFFSRELCCRKIRSES